MGGEVFTEKLLINVSLYSQNDKRWAKDEIGNSGSIMGSEGCAVASIAMLLSYYGIDTNPKELNNFLTSNSGYTDRGWIYWNKVCELADGKIKFTYAGRGSHELIDENIERKNPVIVKVFLCKTIPHWILAVGKEGQDYLVNDLLDRDDGVSKLSKFGSDIYAVRVYEKIRE